MIRFVVFGHPATAGNKTAFPIRRANGKLGVAVREGKKAGPSQEWRARVQAVMQEHANRGAPMLDGPLGMHVRFLLPRPSSAPKRRRTWPDRKPDLSKLLRAIEDPMIGVLVADDARIVQVRMTKDYAEQTDDPRPRAEVALWSVQDVREGEEVKDVGYLGPDLPNDVGRAGVFRSGR